PVSTAVTSQFNFYFPSTSTSDKIADDSAPYSTITYEPSPLNRPVFQIDPGSQWLQSNKGRQITYGSNDPSVILNWTINPSSGLPEAVGSVYYPGSVLSKKVLLDEDYHISEVYTDFQDKKIV